MYSINNNQNNNDGYELDWDSEVEASEFTLLPAGVYPFRVINYERARHNASANLPACAQAIVHVEVDGGQAGKRKIDHNLFLHSKTQGFLNEFFKAIGCQDVNGKIKMDWNRVAGATGRCEIYIDKYTNRNGEQRESNKIKKFILPAQGVAGTAPTVPQQSWTQPAPQTPQEPQGWAPGAF